MLIHKEGIVSVGLGILFFLLALCTWYYFPGVYSAVGVLLVSVLLFFIFYFFRNPNRHINRQKDNTIYAPADGKVVVIEKTMEAEYFNDERLQISIFMSPLNVHVNRYSIGGIIEYVKHHHGKYLVAWNPKSSTENERCTTVIKSSGATILIRQIAGALARRIVNYAEVGETVQQGADMGFIKIGSRVDIFLPLSAEVNVEMGETVKGNRTILAELR